MKNSDYSILKKTNNQIKKMDEKILADISIKKISKQHINTGKNVQYY